MSSDLTKNRIKNLVISDKLVFMKFTMAKESCMNFLLIWSKGVAFQNILKP